MPAEDDQSRSLSAPDPDPSGQRAETEEALGESISLAADLALISRARAGDAEAFDSLMRQHMDRVYALAYRMLRDREEALDVVQEVFIRLHGSIGSLRAEGHVTAWLYRVCVNRCIDHTRRRRAETVPLDEATLADAAHAEPDQALERRELQRAVLAAVDALPPRQRAVFLLRHYEHLSLEEIGRSLGCATGTVKAHLSRATAKVREALAEYLGRSPRGGESA
jgi:RNA polymerase sigma-70 factor (ECF subfamily)